MRGVFLLCSPLQILRQGFSLNLVTLMELGWLASEFSGFFLLCLSSAETANTGHHAWLSMWVQGIRTQAPMPAHHSALPMEHLPSLPLPVIELRCEMTHCKFLFHENILGYLGRMVIKRKCGRQEWVGLGGDTTTATLLIPAVKKRGTRTVAFASFSACRPSLGTGTEP